MARCHEREGNGGDGAQGVRTSVAAVAGAQHAFRRLADQGLAVVLISHNLVDVFEVADRIAALYLGQLAAEVKTKDVRQPQVVELITTGRTEGVESELETSVDEGVTA